MMSEMVSFTPGRKRDRETAESMWVLLWWIFPFHSRFWVSSAGRSTSVSPDGFVWSAKGVKLYLMPKLYHLFLVEMCEILHALESILQCFGLVLREMDDPSGRALQCCSRLQDLLIKDEQDSTYSVCVCVHGRVCICLHLQWVVCVLVRDEQLPCGDSAPGEHLWRTLTLWP